MVQKVCCAQFVKTSGRTHVELFTWGNCFATASATIDETDPDKSLLRLFISDWKLDIICISIVNIGSEDGWVGVGKRDGPGAVSGGGWVVWAGGVTGLASWLGGNSSSKPDHGEPRSWSPLSSPGMVGEVIDLPADSKLSLDADRAGGAGGRTASQEENNVASAHNNILTLEGEYNATLFFFQRFTKVRFHLTQVLRAREEGDGSCPMSARNVWQGWQEDGS